MLALTLVAIAAAMLMALGAYALVRRSVLVPVRVVLAAAALCLAVTGAAAAASGAMRPEFAVAIAAGALPLLVPILAATRARSSRIRTMLLVSLSWAAVVVPVTIVGPALVMRACAADACVIADFGGALPFVIGAGAFLLVPSMTTLGRNALRSGAGSGLVDAAASLAIWGGFVVWLCALEGDVDDFVPLIAAAAVLAPACGAVGWVIVDRVRGVASTVRRSARLGMLAGMASVIGCVVAVSTPWAGVIGFLGGAVGALVHDARGMSQSAPGTRAAVTAIVVGTLGMIAPGLVSETLGFAFAARVDVLGLQFLASLAVTVLSILVSIPVAVPMWRRRAR